MQISHNRRSDKTSRLRFRFVVSQKIRGPATFDFCNKIGHNRPPPSQQAAPLFDHLRRLAEATEPRFATAAAGLAPTADASEACRRSTGGHVHPGDGCSPETGGAGDEFCGPAMVIERPPSVTPSAQMCKRCSLLTELRRDRAEVSLFQWRKRRHIYRVAAACAVVAWVLSQLVAPQEPRRRSTNPRSRRLRNPDQLRRRER
jgi:hypothetical protein